MTEPRFKIGDKIAAAVLSYKRAGLRVGVIEKIHDETTSIHVKRFTIRDEKGTPHVVSSSHAVHLERDDHHTMDELYYYRMLYNAHLFNEWAAAGKYRVVKSANHSDGEPCFGGGYFIVVAELPAGQVSNHYKWSYWNLFEIPAVQLPPQYDGHTPHEAAARLLDAL